MATMKKTHPPAQDHAHDEKNEYAVGGIRALIEDEADFFKLKALEAILGPRIKKFRGATTNKKLVAVS